MSTITTAARDVTESSSRGDSRAQISATFDAMIKSLETGSASAISDHVIPGIHLAIRNYGTFDGVDAAVTALAGGPEEVDAVRLRVTNSYIAVSGQRAQQSAYLTGVYANEQPDGSLDPYLFGGHVVTTFSHNGQGWKVSALRFELDWHNGNPDLAAPWNAGTPATGRRHATDTPTIVSELDSPWRVVPEPDEAGSAAEQVAETYIRYAWALDQADFDLLATTFTDDAKADMSPFGPMDGRREIVGRLKSLRIGQPYMQHAAMNFRPQVDGDRASMEIFRLVPYVPDRATLDAPIFGARYESRLRREDGVWKFEWLHYIPGWIRGTDTAPPGR
ncbi:nuclear transport factor 2 family protein [Rhodococcus koreensis]